MGDELKRLNIGCWKRVLSGLGSVQLRLDAVGGDICDGMIVRCDEIVCEMPMFPPPPLLDAFGLPIGPEEGEEEEVAKTPR